MMSGMRNSPPISISSPRETTTSLPWASVSSARSTAAAQLFTTSEAGGPPRGRRAGARRVEREHRRRAIVHDERGGRPREAAKEALEMRVARAPLLPGDVHLEVGIRLGGAD